MSGVAPDGSPVVVYKRLPPLGEDELVASAVPEGATILELGCGAGRITHPLVDRGYAVTAVDSSEAMLAEVRGAETLLASVETLDLGRRFSCVLLAGHFVNDPDAARRRLILDVCARHVEPHGVVVIEADPPAFEWREAELLGEDELRAELGAAHLTFGRWLDRDRGWFVACAS